MGRFASDTALAEDCAAMLPLPLALTGLKRLADRRPMHAQLVVTDDCNLACRYCHEFTAGAPHVPLATLKARIDRLARLGVFAYDLLGGEPLLHPDLPAIVRHIKAARPAWRGGTLATVITNAFLLTPARIDALGAAGLDALQVSIDSVEPTRWSEKSLRTALPKLRLLAERARFVVKIQTVLTETSLEQYEALREALAPFPFGFSFSLLHGPDGRIAVKGERFVELVRRHDLFQGVAFFRDDAEALLRGDFSRPWKCLGGYKYLYVNTRGEVQPCSQVRAGAAPLLSLEAEHLEAADAHKPCEPGCAVGCVRTVSHAVNEPWKTLAAGLRFARWHGRPETAAAPPAPTPAAAPR